MNMAKRFIAVLLVVIISFSAWGSAQAQTDLQYFPESGHYVKGAFLQYYKSAVDPMAVYGYPITEQISSKDGKTVQYFNKARFEFTPENKVVLTPLGRLMYKPENPLPVSSASGCQQYPSGFSVCLSFLKFYKENGENRQFGYPISSFEYSANGLLVQYFEGARLEWNTNPNGSNWVMVTDLGRLYFDDQNEDRAHLQPAPPPDATIKPFVSLKARAFVLKAVTLKTGSQTIYVIAKDDRTSQAISDASVTAIVYLSDGTNKSLSFSTNSTGIGLGSFDFTDQKPGELITIDITIDYQGHSTTTTTSFRVWF